MIDWSKTTREDADVIHKIAKRALACDDAGPWTLMDVEMDITACHIIGCRLRLADLLAAPALDFAHDIVGIRSHIDRETGKLGDGFLPRYAA